MTGRPIADATSFASFTMPLVSFVDKTAYFFISIIRPLFWASANFASAASLISALRLISSFFSAGTSPSKT